MTSDIRSVVGAPGFRPHLREGLRFVREAELPGVVVVLDPIGNKRLQLYEVECLIAKQMDGTRDLDAIAKAAKPHVPWATRPQVEKLTVQIAGMGLLSNVPFLARGTPANVLRPIRETPASIAAIKYAEPTVQPPPLAIGPNVSQFDELDANTILNPQSEMYTPEPVDIESEPDEPASRQPEPVSPPQESDLRALIADAEMRIPPEPPQAPQEAKVEGDAWVVEKDSWYKRRWARRVFYYLVVPSLIIGILAIIPYPLYVTEPCTVYPSSRSHVRTPIDGIVAEIYVGEGDLVKAGAPLVRLDDREISFGLQKAEADLQRLKSNLEKQKKGSRPEEIKKAQARVTTQASEVGFAMRNLQRKTQLAKDGVGSVMERDEARRDLAMKQALLSEANADLKLVRAGFRSEEVAIAEAEVKRAEAEVQHFRKQMSYLVIKAPISGRVLTPRFRERLHEKLKEGDLVVELGDVTTVRLEIKVPEREADVLQIGQPVTLKVHSLPLRAFHGTVKFIAPAVEESKDGSSRILRVDAELANEEALLYPGMTGYAEIDAGTRSVLSRITRRAIRWIRVRFLV